MKLCISNWVSQIDFVDRKFVAATLNVCTLNMTIAMLFQYNVFNTIFSHNFFNWLNNDIIRNITKLTSWQTIVMVIFNSNNTNIKLMRVWGDQWCVSSEMTYLMYYNKLINRKTLIHSNWCLIHHHYITKIMVKMLTLTLTTLTTLTSHRFLVN